MPTRGSVTAEAATAEAATAEAATVEGSSGGMPGGRMPSSEACQADAEGTRCHPRRGGAFAMMRTRVAPLFCQCKSLRPAFRGRHDGGRSRVGGGRIALFPPPVIPRPAPTSRPAPEMMATVRRQRSDWSLSPRCLPPRCTCRHQGGPALPKSPDRTQRHHQCLDCAGNPKHSWPCLQRVFA